MQKKLKIGNEVKVYTKDGKAYEGILMDFHKDHLSTLASLGIILTFPLNSILNIIKI